MNASWHKYWSLVEKHNKVSNLTAIDNYNDWIAKGIKPSLAFLSPLGSGLVLDVGSGQGLPGIVIAIQRPDLFVHLLEPRLRRSSFLRLAVYELGLKNCKVITARSENHIGSYDWIVSRAVANPVSIFNTTKHLAHDSSFWVLHRPLKPFEHDKFIYVDYE